MAASVGSHGCSGVPLKVKKYRLIHSRAGDIAADICTHFEIGGDDDVASRLGLVWSKEASNSLPLICPKQKKLPVEFRKPSKVNENLVAGACNHSNLFVLPLRFELIRSTV